MLPQLSGSGRSKRVKKKRASSIASRAMQEPSTKDIKAKRKSSSYRRDPATSDYNEAEEAKKYVRKKEAKKYAKKKKKRVVKKEKPIRERGGTKTKGPKKSSSSKKGSKKSSRRKSGKKKFTKKKKRKAKVTRATPPSPKKKDTTKLVKTRKDGIPVLQTAFNDNTIEQQQDILNAFLAFSGTELFQYTNEQSIDGMFSDVSIISVLSSRRKDYKPNDIIALNPPFISDIWRGTGSSEEINKLYVDVDGTRNGGTLVLNFYVGINSVLNIIGSFDYV